MTTTAIILAAGQGSRMKSSTPKPLHKIGHRPMLWHALDSAKAAGADTCCVVVGHEGELVGQSAKDWSTLSETPVTIVWQNEQKGTGHAVLCAKEAAQNSSKTLVLFADNPLFSPETLTQMLSATTNSKGVFLGFETNTPTGYGRLFLQNDLLVKCIEEKDANEEERAITFVNAGPLCAPTALLFEELKNITPSPTTGEIYLTKLPELFAFTTMKCAQNEAQGVNDRVQLAKAEAFFQNQMREKAMTNGATLLDPNTTYFAYDTVLEPDTLIEPNVFFGPGVVVRAQAHIKANSHLEGCDIGNSAQVGPFARIRPGTTLDNDTKVGNFVEIKNTHLHAGAKASHLTYLGDADIGANANIGAGTITCNYDGVKKHKTQIGENAFVGSNSALVAPIEIGKGAKVAAGSTLTQNVPDDTLAFGRARQINKGPS